jgi:transposase InsO family protein
LGFGYCRDSYYKFKHRVEREGENNKKVLRVIHQRRNYLPREGGRKLYEYLRPYLASECIKLGRDKLFDLLRNHQMLVEPRRKYKVTTNSRHRFHTYSNLVKGYKPNGPNNLWVSDITYLRTHQGFCYLALVTDAYSRKIVGYDISNSLELEGCVRALKKALKQLPTGQELIHHSDRGLQYCSNRYTDMLKKNQIRISMAAKGNCYENALAERVNGILKDEFFLDYNFNDLDQAKQACNEAIKLYNEKRFHLALQMKTPNQVHQAA